jgi:hypothetical protein
MMRISIWQQWASNHSASFTVVGEFKSAEAANKAAETLRDILVTIAEWYDRPENADLRAQWWEQGEELPPSPPEIDFGKQYGVGWNEHSIIDWVLSRSVAEAAVSVLGSHVFVSNGILEETWLGPKPFDALMEKLGGRVQVTGESGDARLSVAISCIAPDEGTARSVCDQCSTYFSNPHLQPMPWQSYADEQALRAIDPADMARYVAASITSFGSAAQEGSVNRDGLKLEFSGVVFSNIQHGLLALVEYLNGKGCTDIKCVLQPRE